MTADEIQTTVLERIRSKGHAKFSDLQLGLDYRTLDRALQALRRKGRIEFDSKLG